MTFKNLGMMGLDHVQFAVASLDHAKKLYQDRFGFTPLYRSNGSYTDKTGQKSVVYGGGKARIMVSQSVKETSDAARFLRVHPEGVMTVGFRVKDLNHAYKTLCARQATPVSDPVDHGSHQEFEITTPLGEVLFKFVQRAEDMFAPGMEPVDQANIKPGNIPWMEIDHLTSNCHTMRPVTDWYRDVMGMSQYWDVEFHTTQTADGQKKSSGSGLKSLVFWDEESAIKFATNEPLKPFFRQSQIERFVMDNRGAGVQHIALSVPSVIEAVDALQKASFNFLAAPDTYYARLGKRLQTVGWDLSRVREPLAELQRRNILIDGSKEGYMLQIFQEELRQVEGRPEGSPSFYEVIQRAGDRGFGYGNFRALFEAIEAAQAGRVD
jgi:4-hydroxyphenylpyruvate dioxygenase